MNKMYMTNSLWDCFAESIFNAKMIKSPALNSTQCIFPDISSMQFSRICKEGQCRGDGWMVVSVQQGLLSWNGSSRGPTLAFVWEGTVLELTEIE